MPCGSWRWLLFLQLSFKKIILGSFKNCAVKSEQADVIGSTDMISQGNMEILIPVYTMQIP